MDSLNDIKKCICCWCDMLGYSGNLIRANWDLSDQRCKNNLERVNRLVPSFINSSVCNIATKLSFNDGFAITADLEDDGIDLCEKVVYFLDGVIVDYITMNHLDLNANQPGVRGVVSIGSRYNYDSADYTESFGKITD